MFKCKRCGWNGKEKELEFRYFWGVLNGGESSMKEYYCPKCSKLMRSHGCSNEEAGN